MSKSNPKIGPPPLKDVELICPKCRRTVRTLKEIPFVRRKEGDWHAHSVANCVGCARKIELRLRVSDDGSIYAPAPGTIGDPEWEIFGRMDFETGVIITLAQREPEELN